MLTKNARSLIALVALAAFACFAGKLFAIYGVNALALAIPVLILLSSTFEPVNGIAFALTLSGTEILAQTLAAMKTVLPPLFKGFTTDFSAARAKKDQVVIARITQVPSVQSYDATTGYKANAATSTGLLVDVPVTIDQWKHVPIVVKLADQAKAVFSLADEAITNTAYALGKSIVDYALGKVVAANFSQTSAVANASVTLSTLNTIRANMNKNFSDPNNRYAVVNSDVAVNFNEDTRIGSKLFYGQMNGESPLAQWNNLAGFRSIWEYPSMPGNSEFLTGFFFDKRALVVATRLPQDTQEIATAWGIPQVAAYDVVQDPSSGLSLLGIKWIEQGTFDIYYTVALMYGVTAGKQGGSTGVITDYAGYRLTSQ